MGIRNKIFIFLLVAVVLPLALVAVTVLPFHRNQLTARETALLEASARGRAERAAAALRGESQETLQQIADQVPSLGMSPEIIFFSRDPASGSYAPATRSRFDASRAPFYEDMRPLLASAFQSDGPQHASVRDQRGIMTLAAAVRVPGTEHAVVVKLDQDEALRPNAVLRDQFLVLSFIAIALSAMLALILARMVTGPLLRLALTVATFDTPKPERIAIEGKDEVAALARSFRNMWERQTNYNEELKKAVWKRTTEMQEAERSLEAANASLSARLEEIEKLYAMALGSDVTPEEIRKRLDKLRKDAA